MIKTVAFTCILHHLALVDDSSALGATVGGTIGGIVFLYKFCVIAYECINVATGQHAYNCCDYIIRGVFNSGHF